MTPEELLLASLTPPTFDPAIQQQQQPQPAPQGGLIPVVSAPQPVSPSQATSSKSGKPVDDVAMLVAPQLGLGAITGNPLAGGLGGAGLSLLQYFVKKYRSGKQ